MTVRHKKIISISILTLLLVIVIGFREYCSSCKINDEALEHTVIHCPPPVESLSREKEIASFYERLLLCDSNTNHKEIAKLVTEIRKAGIHSSKLAELLSSMLPYQATIYQNRDKWEVLRLRSYILLTLGEIGFPNSAIPSLVDALAYIDERMKVVELGAAIKVVGELGADGNLFSESIINAFNRVYSDEEFSLNKYEVGFSKDEATTVQIEVVKSLGKISNNSDYPTLTFLNSILNPTNNFPIDERVIVEARRSSEKIRAREPQKNISAVTRKNFPFFCFEKNSHQPKDRNPILNSLGQSNFVELNNRIAISNKSISFTDHNGSPGRLEELIDRPTLLTFFYTRCQVDMKCSSTIAYMAALQKQLDSMSIKHQVKLIAITLEPDHDSPDLLKRYLSDRSVNANNNSMAIKLEIRSHYTLMKELQIPVGYNSGWVNGHGVEAVLIDKNKGIVRKYYSLFPSNLQMLKDFSRLASE